MTDRPNKFTEGTASSDGVGGSNPSRSKPSVKPRKAIPVKVQVSVALGQVWCGLCPNILKPDEPRILEHMTPHATMIALGRDPDAIENLRWCHKECSDRKTNGTKATCASGDLHKIAKAKRLDVAREAHRAILAGETTREPGKIKSRGFQKVHRPMRRAP